MILTAFAIYDAKAKAYLAPFYFAQQGQATRVFADCINDPTKQHAFARNPEDYSIWQIGTFDDETAAILNSDRELLANGLHLLDPNPSPGQNNEQVPHDTPVPPGT